MENAFNKLPNNNQAKLNNQIQINFEKEDTIKAALDANGLGLSLLDEVYEKDN